MRISDSLVEKLLKAADKVTAEQLAGLHEQEKAEKKAFAGFSYPK